MFLNCAHQANNILKQTYILTKNPKNLASNWLPLMPFTARHSLFPSDQHENKKTNATIINNRREKKIGNNKIWYNEWCACMACFFFYMNTLNICLGIELGISVRRNGSQGDCIIDRKLTQAMQQRQQHRPYIHISLFIIIFSVLLILFRSYLFMWRMVRSSEEYE